VRLIRTVVCKAFREGSVTYRNVRDSAIRLMFVQVSYLVCEVLPSIHALIVGFWKANVIFVTELIYYFQIRSLAKVSLPEFFGRRLDNFQLVDWIPIRIKLVLQPF